jgi:hypothetical protein
LASAGTGSDDWLTLDEEIDRLASSQPVQNVGPSVGALIRPVYDMQDMDGDTPDIGGFSLHDADGWLEGTIGDTSWRLSVDFAAEVATTDDFTTEVQLEDAYGLLGITDQVGLTFGQFKTPALHASRIDPENQILFNRPWIAQGFDFWDEGAMVDVSSGQFGAYFSIQNGLTGIEAIHAYMARVEFFFNAMTGGMLWSKRTTGKLPENTTMVGVFHYEDDVASDAQLNGIDVATNFNNAWRVEAEVVDVDEDAPGVFAGTAADSTPWDIGGQFMFNQNFDIGARYQDADDDDDTSGFTVGLDYYPGDPNIYWSVEFDIIDSDSEARDTEAFRVGLTVGASRTR